MLKQSSLNTILFSYTRYFFSHPYNLSGLGDYSDLKKMVSMLPTPWLRRLVISLSMGRPWVDSRPVHVAVAVTLGQVLPQVLWFPIS